LEKVGDGFAADASANPGGNSSTNTSTWPSAGLIQIKKVLKLSLGGPTA
jgi:hypothetical protein